MKAARGLKDHGADLLGRQGAQPGRRFLTRWVSPGCFLRPMFRFVPQETPLPSRAPGGSAGRIAISDTPNDSWPLGLTQGTKRRVCPVRRGLKKGALWKLLLRVPSWEHRNQLPSLRVSSSKLHLGSCSRTSLTLLLPRPGLGGVGPGGLALQAGTRPGQEGPSPLNLQCHSGTVTR